MDAPSLKSRRTQNRLLAVGALVLVAGAVAAIITLVGSSGSSFPEPTVGKPADVSKPPKTVKLDGAARKVAREFLATNVVRENLSEGYKLVGPHLKEGLTLAEWKTGNIPVVPYPADAIDVVPIQILYSYPREARLKVFLLPKKGMKIKGASFYLGLIRVGKGPKARWLVDYWTPYASVQVPSYRSN